MQEACSWYASSMFVVCKKHMNEQESKKRDTGAHTHRPEEGRAGQKKENKPIPYHLPILRTTKTHFLLRVCDLPSKRTCHGKGHIHP